MSANAAIDLDALDATAAEVAASPTPDPAPAASAPAAAPAAQPEAKADAATAAAAQPAQPAQPSTKAAEEPTVPVAALTAERRKFREEVSAREAKIAELQQQLDAAKKPAQEPPKPPEFAEDPKGYVDANAQAQAERIRKLEQQIAQENESKNAFLAQQRALAAVRQQESEFAKQNGDYYDALEHSRNIRREQLRIFAPEASAEQIDAELTRQELATAFGMLQAGQNPAERAYAYAKTLGYSPKQAAAMAAADAGKTTPATQPRAADGTFAAQPAAPQLTPEQQAEIEQRKMAAMSLGAGGGEGLMEAEAALSDAGDPFEMARNERFKR